MAFKTARRHRVFASEGTQISVNETSRLEALEPRLNLVAAAEGKSKGDVVADALEAYLPGRWAEIVKKYNE